MKCPYCSNEIPAGAANCPSCGAAAPQPPPQPQPQQGQYQQAPQVIIQQVVPQPQYPPKSRVAYILLGLFLGGLGIHNFYAGYVGKAIVQLLIVLFLGWLVFPLIVVGLWILLEVIIVNKDARGVPFN